MGTSNFCNGCLGITSCSMFQIRLLRGIGFVALLSGQLLAGKIENNIGRDFRGFSVFEKVAGDLNGDGVVDYVATLWKNHLRTAPVVVYFGNGKGDFILQTKAPVANCFWCGGMKGTPNEPIGRLSINNKGILVMTFKGGSREVWTDVLKWRFDKKQKEFFLIGETYTSVDNFGEEPTERTDINYSTGKMEKNIGKKGKICQFSLPLKMILRTFDFENQHVGDLFLLTKKCLVDIPTR